MDQFFNAMHTSNLWDEDLINEILSFIDTLPSPNVVGQMSSPVVANTPVEGQGIAPAFFPSEQVQPVAHPVSLSTTPGLYTNASPLQTRQTEPVTAIMSYDAEPSEQRSSAFSLVHRSTRSTNRPKNFQCSQCPRLYDRSSRAQTCENNHLGIKRYRCDGRCGQQLCQKKYASPSGLDRHCLPQHEKAIVCEDCGRKITRHNMARHQKVCGGRL